jgi:hypothetical protein
MRHLLLLPLLATVAACAASAGDEPRSAKAQQELDRYLGGKVAGTPQSCLPTFRRDDMVAVDNNTVLFRDGANRYWRNDPVGGCHGLGQPGVAMVTKTFGGGQLCRGDIVTMTDLSAGVVVGSCSLSDFVPYTGPARGR